jgi:hypothetical protein
MALTLNSTISDDAANSYVTLAYCDAYWDDHYLTLKAASWAALTDPQKIAALIHGCRAIEALRFTERLDRHRDLSFGRDLRSNLVRLQDTDRKTPRKAVGTQSLQFPRNLDYDADGVYYIPEAVMMSQCEQAVFMLTADESAQLSSIQGLKSESVRVGNVSVSQEFTGKVGPNVSPVSVNMLSPFLLRASTKLGRA